MQYTVTTGAGPDSIWQIELLPCPFCGSRSLSWYGDRHYCSVICSHCWSAGPDYKAGTRQATGVHWGCADYEAAGRLWNIRAEHKQDQCRHNCTTHMEPPHSGTWCMDCGKVLSSTSLCRVSTADHDSDGHSAEEE